MGDVFVGISDCAKSSLLTGTKIYSIEYGEFSWMAEYLLARCPHDRECGLPHA